MKIINLAICLLIVVFFINSCLKHKNNGINNEIVMSEGMVIKAENKNGSITIEAAEDYDRLYLWDNSSIKIKLIGRGTRWNGSLGIYNPGSNKNYHTIIEEGQQHFYSEEEAIEWLSWQDNKMQYVYSKDGLVVGWYKTKNAISVQVWQFYILGNKPNKLTGARNDFIKVFFKKGALPQQVRGGNFQPSSPRMITGRWYSGKSIDIMNEKKITPEIVERTIRGGNYEQHGNYLYYYNFDNNKLLWILLDTNQRVVLLGD